MWYRVYASNDGAVPVFEKGYEENVDVVCRTADRKVIVPGMTVYNTVNTEKRVMGILDSYDAVVLGNEDGSWEICYFRDAWWKLQTHEWNAVDMNMLTCIESTLEGNYKFAIMYILIVFNTVFYGWVFLVSILLVLVCCVLIVHIEPH